MRVSFFVLIVGPNSPHTRVEVKEPSMWQRDMFPSNHSEAVINTFRKANKWHLLYIDK